MSFSKKYIKKYWKMFTIALVCLTMEAICDLMQPTIMSKIIDVGVANSDMEYVLKMGALMLGVTAIGAIFASSRNILASIVSRRFGSELREDLFKKVQGLSFETMNKYDGATLVTRLTNDVTQVQNFANGLMRIFVKAPILCIGSVIMAVNLNAKMALIFLIVIPVVGVLIVMNMKVGYPLFSKIQKSLDKVNSVMREYLAGVRVVKAFNRFSYEKKRFSVHNEELTDISSKAMRAMAIFSPGIMFTVNIGIVAIIWIGGIRVNSGTMEVGEIMAFVNYMTQILFSLTVISRVFAMFVKAKASYERIGEVLLEEECLEEKKEKLENHEVRGKVEFNNVTFSYYGDLENPVLRDVSFSCNEGETLGIIGSTGSGKSTLVNLIGGFYENSLGSIKINDVDIKDLDVKSLRDKIAIVPQKVVLFSGTVMENLRWGKDDATEKEIEEVTKVSEAYDFIEKLPEKYNTVLGQGGINLSGGQKQRVSIARALIRKPEILILDDCTSALDVITESKIRGALNDYSKNLTTIIIAQRITSVMNSDKIVVLDNGSICGYGNHSELIESCEVYKDIFISQIGKEMLVNEK